MAGLWSLSWNLGGNRSQSRFFTIQTIQGVATCPHGVSAGQEASGLMIRVRKTRHRETAVLIRVTWSPEAEAALWINCH
jgi:hypothetical protein